MADEQTSTPEDEAAASPADQADAAETGARPASLLEEEARLEVLKSWWKADSQHSASWRKEAAEDFEFREGEGQWSTEDRATLSAQNRTPITFNRVLAVMKAVAGMEINGRHEVHFIPRGNEDAKLNEDISAASKWMGDGCDAEDEESQAFEHCTTCGLGVTENRLDYEDDPNGKYVEECVDPLEMYWDRTARKKNYSDARRMSRVRQMPLADAMVLFPGKTKEALDATWASESYSSVGKTVEEKRKRDENASGAEYDDQYEVTIVNTVWWERESYWLIADPNTNQKAELTDEQYRTLTERMKLLGMPVTAVKMSRKVYHEAWIGRDLLKCGPAPLKGRFKWACITGEPRHQKGTFFGLVRVMRDPQMWANKWLSQSLHILNSTAKGGILAEKDAFDNERDAEDKWARPDSIVWMAKHALSGPNPKVMPKPGQGFPQGYIELMNFAVAAVRDVPGINLELIGLRDVNQPGILEAMRKQAGMTVLATQFDSLRRFRKIVGRIRLFYIQEFFSDGRLIRVIGEQGAKSVPLMKDKCAGEYDVVVDDTPTSPNQREQNWQIIQPMLGLFKNELAQNPELMAAILEYSPLPSRLVELVKRMIQERSQEMTPEKKLEIANKVATVNQKQSAAELNLAKAGSTQAVALYDIAMAQHLLEKNDGQDTTKEMLQALEIAANVDKKDAEAGKIRAQTHGAHADTAHTLVKAVTEAHTPPPQPPAPPEFAQ